MVNWIKKICHMVHGWGVDHMTSNQLFSMDMAAANKETEETRAYAKPKRSLATLTTERQNINQLTTTNFGDFDLIEVSVHSQLTSKKRPTQEIGSDDVQISKPSSSKKNKLSTVEVAWQPRRSP